MKKKVLSLLLAGMMLVSNTGLALADEEEATPVIKETKKFLTKESAEQWLESFGEGYTVVDKNINEDFYMTKPSTKVDDENDKGYYIKDGVVYITGSGKSTIDIKFDDDTYSDYFTQPGDSLTWNIKFKNESGDAYHVSGYNHYDSKITKTVNEAISSRIGKYDSAYKWIWTNSGLSDKGYSDFNSKEFTTVTDQKAYYSADPYVLQEDDVVYKTVSSVNSIPKSSSYKDRIYCVDASTYTADEMEVVEGETITPDYTKKSTQMNSYRNKNYVGKIFYLSDTKKYVKINKNENISYYKVIYHPVVTHQEKNENYIKDWINDEHVLAYYNAVNGTSFTNINDAWNYNFFNRCWKLTYSKNWNSFNFASDDVQECTITAAIDGANTDNAYQNAIWSFGDDLTVEFNSEKVVTGYTASISYTIDEPEYYYNQDIKVIKKVVDQDGDALKVNDQFTFKLFMDKNLEEPVVDDDGIQYETTVVLNDASKATVVFEGVPVVKEGAVTYYIGEYDGAGNLIDTAKYKGGNAVEVSIKKNGVKEVTNVIDGPEYYYDGQIKITKNVVNRKGNAMNVHETFYAGVFEDNACTKYVKDEDGNNIIVPLVLSGKSSATSTVTVPAGEKGKSTTYYVREVDSKGNAVENNKKFEYKVAYSNSSVKVSAKAAGSVTITNQKKGFGVLTGENGEMMLYVMLAMVSAGAMVTIYRKRKEMR